MSNGEAALFSALTGEPAEITVNDDMREVIDAAEAALLALPGAPIYQRAGLLVRVTRDAKPPRFLDRPAGAPTIEALPADFLVELLSRAARWAKPDGRSKEGMRSTRPPAWVAHGLLARPRDEWNAPVLTAVVSAPSLRADGEILSAPGLDVDSGVLFVGDGTRWPEISSKPTLAQAQAALDLLREAIVDFPFRETCDRSAALSAILTCCARPAIIGPAPLFAISASAPGTGKGLLADLISTIATGRPPARMPQATDDREEAKRLMGIALAGDPIVLVDNVGRLFGSPSLDAALTSEEIADRILGESRIVRAPWSAVVLVTGNNLAYRGDTGRRVVPIDLDAQVENPEEREGFEHDPLLPWVQAQRPRLLASALTILRAFFVAGRPGQRLSPFGSFEAWSNLVRQALVWAGETDPAEGRARIREEGEPIREALGAALAGWAARWGDQPMTARGIAAELNGLDHGEGAALREALGALCARYSGQLTSRALGNAIRNHRGRIVGGLRFERAGVDHQAACWRVSALGSVGSVGSVSTHLRARIAGEKKEMGREQTPQTPQTPQKADSLADRLGQLGARAGSNGQAREVLTLAGESLDAGDLAKAEARLDQAEAILDGAE